MNRSETLHRLAPALLRARRNFQPIKRTKTVTVRTERRGSYEFKYAPLDEIHNSVEPALSGENLAVIQNIGGNGISTMILHESGEFLESDLIPLNVNAFGTQFGAEVTFKRRYQYTGLLNLASEDDNDADEPADKKEKTGMPARPITPTTGVMDMVPVGEQEVLRRLADGINEAFENGNVLFAFESYEGSGFVGEKAVALWSLLGSRVRSTIKKMQIARTAQDTATTTEGAK